MKNSYCLKTRKLPDGPQVRIGNVAVYNGKTSEEHLGTKLGIIYKKKNNNNLLDYLYIVCPSIHIRTSNINCVCIVFMALTDRFLIYFYI